MSARRVAALPGRIMNERQSEEATVGLEDEHGPHHSASTAQCSNRNLDGPNHFDDASD